MNLRCDCISCKYEKQQSTEDPCYRCYDDSEYVYDGGDRRRIPMPASEHFVNVVYGFAVNRRTAIANPSIAVCFEAYTEKPTDAADELLVLVIKGTHIHSTRVSQVKKMISYAQLLSSTVANNMCMYFVNDAFNEMEMFLNDDLLTRAKHFAKEDSNEQ